MSHAVRVNVMLPLDTVTDDGHLKNPSKLRSDLQKLSSAAHIDGIMTDVWFGIVESSGPQQYNFQPYHDLVTIASDLNLTMQVVMSFHKCGGNTGDVCNIPLPSWILQAGSPTQIFYTDAQSHSDSEYISLGVDHLPIFPSSTSAKRTAIQVYEDFMKAFRSEFGSVLGSVINKIEVGLGPCGELRYPSYQMDRWNYPGIGEFQCYDTFMLKMLSQAAEKAGHPEWGHGGPSNAGTYDSKPDETGFFSDSRDGNNNWCSEYGEFFLGWYSQTLLTHADDILKVAHAIFDGSGAELAVKISGVHWWHGTDSRAAELTAGYYDTSRRNGYVPIAQLLEKYGTEFQFTCLEMTDESQAACHCASQPEELVEQTKKAAFGAGISYAGENALAAFSDYQYNQMVKMANGLSAITYLRLCDTLLQEENLARFASFVQRCHEMQE